MDCKELQTGDIIKYNGRLYGVEAVDAIYDTVSFFDREAEGYLDIRYNKIEPVELTAEILDKLPGFVCESVWSGLSEYSYTVDRHDDIEYKGLKFSTAVKLTVTVGDDGKVRSLKLKAFTDKGIFNDEIVKRPDSPYYLHELQRMLSKADYGSDVRVSVGAD